MLRYLWLFLMAGCLLFSYSPPAKAGDFPVLLSTYTTWFDSYPAARAENIRLAAGALDGRIVGSGEVFSFNATTGPRSRERGYREAMILIQGTATPGIGGGICQVASTLYNVVLRAGLPVVERHPHSRPVPYVPLGTDATVGGAGLDLRFRNNLPLPVKIAARVGKDYLTISLYGPPGHYRRVGVVSVVEGILPPPARVLWDYRLPQGKHFLEQQGRSGYQVVVLRDGEGGPQVVSRDVYPPLPRVTRAGAEKR